MSKPTVLFLCTGNSCRSQMAEGWSKALRSEDFIALSAGVDPHGKNPSAVQVMAEAGVDISNQESQNINDFDANTLDVVVTVCSHAKETCQIFPEGTRVVHRGFEDPPALARGAANEEEALDMYRQVRDEIKQWIANVEMSELLG